MNNQTCENEMRKEIASYVSNLEWKSVSRQLFELLISYLTLNEQYNVQASKPSLIS